MLDDELIRGLKALAAGNFPKVCRCCGRSFRDVADYTSQTSALPGGRSGLKQSLDDDGQVIVDFFRNCPCGSTLLDSFNNRRDLSNTGLEQRRRFGELIDYLNQQGLAAPVARTELLKVLRGDTSDTLKQFRPPPKRH